MDDPVRRRADITLAQQMLHWSPSTPLADGLRGTIAYFERLRATQREKQEVPANAALMHPASPLP